MKKITFLFALMLLSIISFAQCNGRYQTEIFNSVSKTTVNYSDVFTDAAHEVDIYTPDGDTETNRPLILFLHGGAFYAGDKLDLYCVDFCETFAKKGYVVASVNYRLVSITDITTFLTSNIAQYEAVLKGTFDLKAAVRYFRKDYATNNSYGIDPNTIFVGGYSAGAVAAIHLAYIDSISDLPTTPNNIQTLANSLGGIEGDAGNFGYSSSVSGIISFAGGIHNTDWITSNDEPLVSCQGNSDATVPYNCGPALNNSAMLNLCGAGKMHPILDSLSITNDQLIFTGVGHDWPVLGNAEPKFIQAMDFTKDFLYPLLPCNNATSINDIINTNKQLIKITDLLGRETSSKENSTLIYFYNDGSVEKKHIIQ